MTARRRLVLALAIVLAMPIVLYGLGWAVLAVAPRADDYSHRLAFDARGIVATYRVVAD